MGNRLRWANARILTTTAEGHEIQFAFPGEVDVLIENTYRDGALWDFGDGMYLRDPDRVVEVSIILVAKQQPGQDHIYEVRRLNG